MLATFDHSQFQLSQLLPLKHELITVCIPTRETASTIEATVRSVVELGEEGLVDQILVIDAESVDDTAQIAEAAGAEVIQEESLLQEIGPVEGKGDAMWRALSASRGELVVYLDGDVKDFGSHYVVGLLGPLLHLPAIDFVKGSYRRPFSIAETEIEDGGGRVTELTARPLLELLAPELSSFRQPLAGEVAARRTLLTEIPYFTGYGVEIAMLVDVWNRVGIEAMAQVDLGSKRNSHQSLTSLAGMARDVLAALAWHADMAVPGVETSTSALPAILERIQRRPPIADLAASGTGT